MQRISDKTRGFTIVEVIIVVAVLGLLTGVVLGALGDFYQANTASLGRTNQDTSTRSALRTVEKELANIIAFQATLTNPPTPQGPNNNLSTTAWSYQGIGGSVSDRRVLIAQVPATTQLASNDPNNTRLPVIASNGAAGLAGPSCSSPTSSDIVKNIHIYFLKSDANSATGPYTLYRRTIVNPTNQAYCPGMMPIQKDTCATGVIDPLNRCRGLDARLAENITKLEIAYYRSADLLPTSLIPYGGTTTAADIEGARAIEIKLTSQKLIDGQQTPSESKINIVKH